MIETLSAPAFRLRGARDDVEQDAAVLGARRDVEEGDLVGLLLVVAASDLDRVAGIDVVDVADALHDAPAVDVEAGDDALQEHAAISRARPRSSAPV
jgi:hypothetical protein